MAAKIEILVPGACSLLWVLVGTALQLFTPVKFFGWFMLIVGLAGVLVALWKLTFKKYEG